MVMAVLVLAPQNGRGGVDGFYRVDGQGAVGFLVSLCTVETNRIKYLTVHIEHRCSPVVCACTLLVARNCIRRD